MSSVRRAKPMLSKLLSRRRKSVARTRNLQLAERLELRQVMAGDANPFHNGWYAQDVNNDFKATPLDALMVINALNSGGARKLGDGTVAAAQGEDGGSQFIDVDGDGYLTPSDALLVINHLNAGGEAPKVVEVRTVLYGEDGQEITDPSKRSGSGTLADPYVYTLSKDDRFGVSIQQRDLRPVGTGIYNADPLGVYGLWTDISFDPTKASLGFSEQQQFSVTVPAGGNNKGKITITVPNLGTTGEIELTRPGTTGNSAAFDRIANANAIRTALNQLTGSSQNDVFRVSTGTVSSPQTYTIEFLGDFVNRDIELITVNAVPAAGGFVQPTINTPPTTIFEPVNIDAAFLNNRANILNATNVNPNLFVSLNTSSTNVDDYFTTGSLAVLGRTGGWGSSNPPIEEGRTIFSPPEGGGYLELMRPYFVATNVTPNGQPLEFNINPAGFNSGDPNSLFAETRTLILSQGEPGQPAPSGVVPVESVDYGAPIRIVIRADVTANNDTATVVEESVDNIINVTANDTNNTVANPSPGNGPFVVTGVGADGKQGSFTIANQGTVNVTAGVVTFTPLPNFAGTFTFQYGLTDTGTDPKAFGSVTITVEDTNDPPTADDDIVNVNEDSGSTDITAVLLAGDSTAPDAASLESLIIVAVNGQASATTSKGSVSVSGGVVTYTPNANASGSDSFTYTVRDSRDPLSTATATVTVNISPSNDPPSFVLTANHTSNEDAGPQTAAAFASQINPGAADANPQETDGPVTFTVTRITPANTLTFAQAPAIDPATGNLTYQAANNAYGTAQFNATARDATGAETTLIFSITVNPVNDAPTFVIPSTFTSDEDQPVGQGGFVSNISAGPNEGTAGVTFTVTQQGSVTGTLAFIAPPTISTNGTLTFTPAANTFGQVTLRVTANDNDPTTPLTSFIDFVLTVNEVNDVPDAVDDNIDIPDGATTIAPVLANDTFAPDTNETLLVDTSVALEFLDPIPSNINGTVSVTIRPDGSGLDVVSPLGLTSGSLRVRYTVRDRPQNDSNGRTDTAVATLTFVSNKLPRAVTETITGVVKEDDGFIFLDVLGNDIRKDTQNGVLTVEGIRFSPSDTLEATPGAEITDSFGNILRISASRNGVEFKPAANFNGSVNFNYVVDENTAGDDGPNETTSTVVVAAVNDVPVFTKGDDVTRLEDSGLQSITGWATGISAGPANESTQTLTFVVENDNNALFSVQPAVSSNGTLTFTPAANANGTATISVRLRDNGGTALDGDDESDVQTFTISLTAVNDAPTFTVGTNPTVNEDSGATTVDVVTTQSPGPADEAGQSLGFSIEGNTNPGLFASTPTIDNDGNISFTPAANAFGSATLTLRLTDNGGTDNGGVNFVEQTVTITVNPVNDVPTFTVGGNQNVNEDAGAQTVGTFITDGSAGPANESSQTLTYLVTNDNSSLFTVAPAISSSGQLTYTLAPNANGSATVSVRLRDNGGTANGGVDESATQQFTITVNAVNDAPSFTKGANVSVAEDLGAYNAAFATAISKGPANESSQTLTFDVSNDNNSLFATQPSIDPVTGNLSFVTAANQFGSATVTVVLRDNGGTANGGVDASAAQTFTITITPVNDVPTFTVGANQNVLEDAVAQSVTSFITNGSPGPANESTQTLQYLVTNDNASLFSVAPAISADGTLTYTLAPNANGSATVTVRLKDSGGTANGGVDTSGPQTFQINVEAVNDPPTANDDPDVRVFKTVKTYDLTNLLANDSSAPDVNENLTITGATIISATVGDSGSPSNANLSVSVLNSTTVRFNNPDEFYGTVVIEYTISDGELSDTARVTLNVVNFLPGFISGTIWVDVDNDGIVDAASGANPAERRIAGVEVFLYGTTIFGNAFSRTAVTNANGQYRFDDPSLPNGGVIPGNYIVSLDNPNTSAIEGAELFTDGIDVNGTVTGNGASSTRIGNNTYQIVFGADGATVANLNFGMLGLQSSYVNIRDHLASSTSNGAIFGINMGASSPDGQQFWSVMYDGWAGMHDLKIVVSADRSTATISGFDTNNTPFSKTLSFAADYNKIRITGSSGDNLVVRIIGTASDFFPTADLVASNSLPGPQGEAMYAEGEGAAYAEAADAVYAEEAWA